MAGMRRFVARIADDSNVGKRQERTTVTNWGFRHSISIRFGFFGFRLCRSLTRGFRGDLHSSMAPRGLGDRRRLFGRPNRFGFRHGFCLREAVGLILVR